MASVLGLGNLKFLFKIVHGFNREGQAISFQVLSMNRDHLFSDIFMDDFVLRSAGQRRLIFLSMYRGELSYLCSNAFRTAPASVRIS